MALLRAFVDDAGIGIIRLQKDSQPSQASQANNMRSINILASSAVGNLASDEQLLFVFLKFVRPKDAIFEVSESH